jgi:hypothetical protein
MTVAIIVVTIVTMLDEMTPIITDGLIPTMLGATIPIIATAATVTGTAGPAIVIGNVRIVGSTTWMDESLTN